MADPESGDLTVELEITDDRLADDEVPIEQTIRTRRNPHGDLAVLTLRTDEGTRSFLVEIGAFGIRGRHPLVEFGANGEILNSWPEAVVFHGSNDGSPSPVHRFEIRVPEVSADTIRGIQMELADNDRSYHTQWRRLAPPRSHARISSVHAESIALTITGADRLQCTPSEFSDGSRALPKTPFRSSNSEPPTVPANPRGILL